jgi:hypothetical protein
VYFHSIIDDQARCDQHVVPLEELTLDLRSAETTPTYVFVTPDLCSDGHDEPCIDGRPGGLASVDVFLKEWIPKITRSRAYKDGGMIVVTWDEANFPGSSEACCDEPTGPSTPSPGINGPGGGQTGTVVISPFTHGGSVNEAEFNHYSLLRSIEDTFSLGHLGYAAQKDLKAFGDDVFNAKPVADAPPANSPAGAVPDSSAGCAAAGRLPRARRGTFRRGTFLSGARVRGRTLVVTTRRAGTLTVRLAGRRVAAPTRLGACTTVRIHLPARHGILRVSMGTARGHERRTLRA